MMTGFESTASITQYLPSIVLSLAIGLLIGAEREWSQRQEKTERVMAGIRTFGLLGLLGGLSALLNDVLGDYAWAVMSLLVALLVAAGYIAQSRMTQDWGMTTEVAMLITFVLGILASAGQPMIAAGLGVLVAALLSLKKLLHSQVHRLTPKEVSGALQLLFISVVMLPLLPNHTMGPLEVFNPYVTWWMVVMIAGLGFVAYVAIRVAGPRSGILLTSALGGIVSSTAMTLTLSRLAPKIDRPDTLAAGLLLTAGLMFPRVLIVCTVLAEELFSQLVFALSLATLIYLVAAIWLSFRSAGHPSGNGSNLGTQLQNPFELGSALKFTAMLVGIMFAVELARRYLGNTGVYALAVISGAADVDAITLSLSRLVGTELSIDIATKSILLAALSNSLVKFVMVWIVAGRPIAMRIAPFVIATVVALGLIASY